MLSCLEFFLFCSLMQKTICSRSYLAVRRCFLHIYDFLFEFGHLVVLPILIRICSLNRPLTFLLSLTSFGRHQCCLVAVLSRPPANPSYSCSICLMLVLLSIFLFVLLVLIPVLPGASDICWLCTWLVHYSIGFWGTSSRPLSENDASSNTCQPLTRFNAFSDTWVRSSPVKNHNFNNTCNTV